MEEIRNQAEVLAWAKEGKPGQGGRRQMCKKGMAALQGKRKEGALQAHGVRSIRRGALVMLKTQETPPPAVHLSVLSGA